MELNRSPSSTPLSSFKQARIGVLLFIASELMFFGGFISAFWVIRFSVAQWPPLGQPRYPVAVTLLNTLFLLASGIALFYYRQKGRPRPWFFASVLLGVLFLLGQGREWIRLIGFGLTMTSSLYGSIFYVIIGAHALHVLCGLLWLLFSFMKPASPVHDAAGIFWYFVVLIWPVLYLVVYILP